MTGAPGLTVRADVPAAGTRAEGLRLGSYAVGFDLIRGVDQRRRINRDEGTRLGIAVWYPAQPSADGAATMSAMDYHVLELSEHPTPSERQRVEVEEVEMLVGWRHVGIVALTTEQARASLAARGVAIRGAAAERRRFPIVLVLGGPYYLSTTAEVLASHGFLVAAPFRFRDQSDELATGDFREYLEKSLGDAEWAVDELRKDPRADSRAITALGHGGGGMQAMLLAMRNRSITSVVNVDAGNFSTRSQPERIPFYSPRLMRVPYLYIATAETRNEQDRFHDFVAMPFSNRTEVVLGSSDVRHHDLSDIGRAVTTPLRLRGPEQAAIERNYSAVQEIVVRFVIEQSANRGSRPATRLADWLDAHKAQDDLTVTVRSGIDPAPTTATILRSLNETTMSDLIAARQRDPEARIFEEHSLSQLMAAASAQDPRLASELADFAVKLHPTSAVLLAQAGEIALAAGQRAKAMESARTCADIKVDSDWQASIAVAKCSALLQRLQ